MSDTTENISTFGEEPACSLSCKIRCSSEQSSSLCSRSSAIIDSCELWWVECFLQASSLFFLTGHWYSHPRAMIRHRFNPWVRKIPWRWKWQPILDVWKHYVPPKIFFYLLSLKITKINEKKIKTCIYFQIFPIKTFSRVWNYLLGECEMNLFVKSSGTWHHLMSLEEHRLTRLTWKCITWRVLKTHWKKKFIGSRFILEPIIQSEVRKTNIIH